MPAKILFWLGVRRLAELIISEAEGLVGDINLESAMPHERYSPAGCRFTNSKVGLFVSQD
jgi:hypothetical protein